MSKITLTIEAADAADLLEDIASIYSQVKCDNFNVVGTATVDPAEVSEVENVEPAEKPKKNAASAKKTKLTEPKEADEAVKEATDITVADLRKLAVGVEKQQIRALLDEFEAEKLTALDKADYPAFHKKLLALVEEEA